MHRDECDAIYFRRADGRVIPRGGYRAEDMIDDAIGADGAEFDPASANGRMIAIMHGVEYCEHDGAEPSAEGWMHGGGAENPSAEVRETRECTLGAIDPTPTGPKAPRASGAIVDVGRGGRESHDRDRSDDVGVTSRRATHGGAGHSDRQWVSRQESFPDLLHFHFENFLARLSD